MRSGKGTRPAIVVVLGLVLGMLGTAPAVAVVDTSFTCPDSVQPAGFADIAEHPETTQRAIDCLAVHGITKGTAPDTFDPSGTVPRWQMALFLVRQASAHGVEIPDPVDHGFTDLDGLSQEAADAIDQLAQLGITLGTSETTFSPHEDVTRWQMALFITRLLAGSGISLPETVTQGFEDLDGLSTQSQTAIDQLANLGIAAGTSSTTFSPFSETLRWHMALFLTRALAVGGVLLPGVGAIDVAPDTHAYLDFGGSVVSRQYTVAVSDAGPFSVVLWPGELIRADGTFEASSGGAIQHCDITMVDGGFHSADSVAGIEPTGTSFTFTVGCTGIGAEVVPVVYSGSALDGLEAATQTDALQPTNAHGFGGGITVVSEATATEFGPVAVDAIDLEANSFTSNGITYFWDSGDTFRIGGVIATMEEFEAAITTGDDLLNGSIYDPNGTSIFELQDDSPVAPSLSSTAVTHDSVTLTYVAAEASDHVEVYSCIGSGCETTLVRSVVNGTDDDPSTAGTQLVIGGLTATTEYDFQAVQIEGADASPKSDVVHASTPVAVSITDVSTNDVDDGAEGWTTLFVVFDQDIVLDDGAVLSDFQIHVASETSMLYSATMLPAKPFGTTNELAINFEFQNDTDPDTQWVLTISAGALDVGAGSDPNGELTATFSH